MLLRRPFVTRLVRGEVVTNSDSGDPVVVVPWRTGGGAKAITRIVFMLFNWPPAWGDPVLDLFYGEAAAAGLNATYAEADATYQEPDVMREGRTNPADGDLPEAVPPSAFSVIGPMADGPAFADTTEGGLSFKLVDWRPTTPVLLDPKFLRDAGLFFRLDADGTTSLESADGDGPSYAFRVEGTEG